MRKQGQTAIAVYYVFLISTRGESAFFSKFPCMEFETRRGRFCGAFPVMVFESRRSFRRDTRHPVAFYADSTPIGEGRADWKQKFCPSTAVCSLPLFPGRRRAAGRRLPFRSAFFAELPDKIWGEKKSWVPEKGDFALIRPLTTAYLSVNPDKNPDSPVSRQLRLFR